MQMYNEFIENDWDGTPQDLDRGAEVVKARMEAFLACSEEDSPEEIEIKEKLRQEWEELQKGSAHKAGFAAAANKYQQGLMESCGAIRFKYNEDGKTVTLYGEFGPVARMGLRAWLNEPKPEPKRNLPNQFRNLGPKKAQDRALPYRRQLKRRAPF